MREPEAISSLIAYKVVNEPRDVGTLSVNLFKLRQRAEEFSVRDDGNFLVPSLQYAALVDELGRKSLARRREIIRAGILFRPRPIERRGTQVFHVLPERS